MTPDDQNEDDRTLRELGGELREADAASAPPFVQTWAAARGRTRKSWVRPALMIGFGGAALATTAAGILLVVSVVDLSGGAAPAPQAIAAVEYEPLHFLLERPLSERRRPGGTP